MPVPDAFTSFDADTAAGADPTVGGAVPVELPPEQQRFGVLWPTPAEMVSDHASEGAPWLPAARGIPTDPPQGPRPAGQHDAAQVAYSAQEVPDPTTGQGIGAGAVSGIHDGTDGLPWDPGATGANAVLPPTLGPLDLGQPFTVNQGGREVRHLRTDQWDHTGKITNPADAPSAPHEIYGSQHFTTPRFIPFELAPLFENVASSNQFALSNPGYLGVSANEPYLAARPFGSVAAQPGDDPYVAASVTGPAVPAAINIDYDPGW